MYDQSHSRIIQCTLQYDKQEGHTLYTVHAYTDELYLYICICNRYLHNSIDTKYVMLKAV